MFDLQPKIGVWDGWVERWREWRGSNRWPVVQAKVLSNVEVEGNEVNYRKLELTYTAPQDASGVCPLIVIWLSKSSGSNDEYAQPGDTVPLLVNPKHPDKAVFADTSQSAGNLRFAVVVLCVLIGIFFMRGCKL